MHSQVWWEHVHEDLKGVCCGPLTWRDEGYSDMAKIETKCLLTTCLYYCHTNLLQYKRNNKDYRNGRYVVAGVRWDWIILVVFLLMSLLWVFADREVGALVSRQLPWENHTIWRNTCLDATLPTRSLMWTTWASMVISWPLTAWDMVH